MLKQKFNHKLLLFCFALLLSRANAQIVKGTDYQNYYSAPIGTFQGINFREAGFSGLYVIPGTDGKEFWTCSDRGVNVDAANANLPGCRPTYDKIYSFPSYAPKIHRIRIQGDSIQILRTINVRRPNNTDASGIFNPTGLGSTALEIPSTDTVQDCANFLAKTTNKDTFGLDPEGIVLDKNGNFWLCEEGGPTVWKLNANGKLMTRYTPYAHLAGAQSVDVAIDTVFSYRKNNRGFEGIAITPNGKIYAIIQSPLLYPTKTAGENTRIHRILEIDPQTNATRMFSYLNDGIIGASGSNQIRLRDWKIGDMAAINDSTFLVLEAALRGTTDIKRLYHININQATVVHSGLYGGLTLEQLVDSAGLAAQNIKPVKKTLAMDLLTNGWPAILEKAEGIAILNDSTVFIGNDNDYGQVSLPENGVAAATGFTSHIIAYQFKGLDKLKNHSQPIQDMQFGKTGMQSSTSPYLVSTKPNASFTSLLSVGDAVGGYRMVGLSDGTGAFDNGNGTFTFLINHELGNTLGINRKHGTKGAFISQWTINKSDLSIISGNDLIKNVKLWNGSSFSSFDTLNPGLPFSRFCAADMPEISALYNSNSGKGTQERIFLNGEEAGPTGRAFAHIATGVNAGTSYELPALGKFSWENALACPTKSDTTIVIGTDDATPGQVYVYLGVKSNTGNEVEKAGLIGGNLYGVAVSGLPIETSGSMINPNTKFTLFPFGNVNNMTGGALDTASNNAGVTRFLRPEDGAWDPKYPNDFYFVTTNGFTSPSRMYRLRFDNILNPSLGGKITAVLDGTEGPKMMDNVCFDKKGHMMIQEDPGNVSHHAKIWKYTPATDNIELIATHDSTRFTSGSANYLTQDEESSGIIDMQDILGVGKFLLVDQAHYSLGGELVEGGQILLYTTTDTVNEFVAMNVASNKIQIAHNDITPSTTDNTDFGNVKINTNLTKTFTIFNQGTVGLKIDSIKIADTSNRFTFIGGSFPAIIKAKDSMNFQVQFAPNKLGVYTANINIFNSDALFEQFNFRIRANSYVCATTNLVNTIVGNTTFCLGDSAVITAQTGTGYLWSNGSTAKTISAKTSGKYFVNLFDALNCIRTSDTITIIANPVPIKPTISQTGNELICSNPSETYYQWYYNGSYVDGGTAKVLKTTIAGSYYIVCKTPLNCSAKSDAFNFVPAVSSIYNQTSGLLNIYPNPVHDRVNILVEENYDYSIINLAGMEVQSGKIIKGNNSIELNKSIQKGIYMIRLNNDNGQLNQQIIKE